MIVSVIIPYLYAWFIGLLAAYEILQFSVNTPGLLYRRALLYLVTGLVAVIVSSIALQYINSVVLPRTGDLLFNYKLLLTLVVRVVSGIGFFVMAIGATPPQEDRGSVTIMSARAANTTIYDQVVRITHSYLGPAANRFIARQVKSTTSTNHPVTYRRPTYLTLATDSDSRSRFATDRGQPYY